MATERILRVGDLHVSALGCASESEKWENGGY